MNAITFTIMAFAQVAAGARDTLFVQQVAATRPELAIAADVAMIVVAVILVVMLAILAFILFRLKKGQDRVTDMIARWKPEIEPAISRVNRISDDIAAITATARTKAEPIMARVEGISARVEEISNSAADVSSMIRDQVDGLSQEAEELRFQAATMNKTLKAGNVRLRETTELANDRLRDAVDLAHDRVHQFNALLEVAQEEAEDAFISAAAAVRGFTEGASTLTNGAARPGDYLDDESDDEDYEEDYEDYDDLDDQPVQRSLQEEYDRIWTHDVEEVVDNDDERTRRTDDTANEEGPRHGARRNPRHDR